MNEYKALEFNEIKQQIVSFCAFSLGKATIEGMQPSFSKLTITRDLERARQALQAVNFNGGFAFSGMKDISFACTKAKKEATLSIQELVDVAIFMRGCELITQEATSIETPMDALNDLIESLVVNKKLILAIENCFSVNYEVLDQASPLLRSLRKQIRETERRISADMQSYIAKNKDSLVSSTPSSRHYRQVVMVKASDKNKLKGLLHGESSSGQTVYIEPEFAVRLNNNLQNLMQQEQDEIDRICRELTLQVSLEAEQLQANLSTCTLLDAIFAKAKWGHAFMGCVATLSDDELIIKDARHPLIDQKQVVANTYRILPPQRQIMITGPNTGGKSVALKTIGLFTLLTHCGCPIVAEEASIPFVDGIFVDIGDQQSITQSLSTFSAHLSNIAHITEHVSPQSLVLLDELGGGTDPSEGESLAIAIIENLRQVGCWVIATTHYGALKNYANQYPEVLSSSVQFNLETLLPTYRYQEQVSGSSYAFEIAEKLNIKPSIVKNAREIKEKNKQEADRLLEILEEKILENQQMEEQLKEQQTQLIFQKEQFTKEQNQLREQLNREKEQAIVEANEYVALIREEADALIEELKAAQKPHEYTQIAHQLKQLQQEENNEDQATPLDQLSVGDQVRILRSSQIGRIVAIEKQSITVDVNHLSMRVKAKDIQKVAPSQRKKKVVSKQISVHALSRPALECNVIGMHVDEGLRAVSKYLDECMVHKLSSARIIHGHGTGVLRQAIHDFLRKNKHVESFRLGGQGEGGVGATVVTLKHE